ncbi:MAG: NADH-quinone oxidoreductase subunit NuoH [Verrucomicrobiales bacterium]|nr:NADH-quinone oxidoreductase subunit NuoH [Verrucomicrobiales bacterium]
MAANVDQIFVHLMQMMVDRVPDAVAPWVRAAVGVGAVLGLFGLLFGLTTVCERKGIARMQNRLGPNRVGPFGFLQFAADGIKSLTKEDVVPRSADRVVHYLAPLALLTPVVLTFLVLPFGRNMVLMHVDTGLLFFFAAGASTELAVFMAGWSSRNKYSLLGAMRAIAQMISYELPFILSTVGVVMIAGTLSTVGIVESQAARPGEWLARWNLFTPWGLAAFLLFLIAAFAEANRSPFDLPEGESEIVAGYFIEYSGFKFALFFMAEYLGMFASSGMAVTLFLGGWTAPVAALDWIPSWLWFFGKLLALIALFIWVRGTTPRLRMDQLMDFAWKFMLPLALLILPVVAVWHYLGGGWRGWLFCTPVLAAAYVLLGRALVGRRRIQRRVYRYAGEGVAS